MRTTHKRYVHGGLKPLARRTTPSQREKRAAKKRARRAATTATVLSTLTLALAGTATASPSTATRDATVMPPAPPASCDTSYCQKVRDTRRVALRIDRVLERYGSPMAGTGIDFAREGRRQDVNPFVVLGIAGIESSFGRAACGFNAHGLGSCGRAWTSTGCVGAGSVSLRELTSWSASARVAVRFIRCRFPDATSVYGLVGYCACGGWYEKVVAFTAAFGSGPGLRWRDALQAVRA